MAAFLREPGWYKDAIVYETHVKAFYDSTGDGVGDLAGLTAKLDYLQDLGITCLWLLPFFPSPLRDDGYDYLRAGLALARDLVDMDYDQDLEGFGKLMNEELANFACDGIGSEIWELKPPALAELLD